MRGQITNRRGAAFAAVPAFHGLPFGIVATASSLGGIAALGRLLGELPADFPLPILVCQHVRRGGPSLLPGILARHTALRVVAAREGEAPVAGSAHIAPPDRHLVVRPDGTLGLSAGEPVSFCRPAADALFRSVAEAHGPRAIAVVLTGRGRDGARGVQAIRARGGFAIAQDEGSSEAFDMPLAARDIGQADLVLPLGRIATALRLLALGEGGAVPAGGVGGAGESQVAPPPPRHPDAAVPSVHREPALRRVAMLPVRSSSNIDDWENKLGSARSAVPALGRAPARHRARSIAPSKPTSGS